MSHGLSSLTASKQRQFHVRTRRLDSSMAATTNTRLFIAYGSTFTGQTKLILTVLLLYNSASSDKKATRKDCLLRSQLLATLYCILLLQSRTITNLISSFITMDSGPIPSSTTRGEAPYMALRTTSRDCEDREFDDTEVLRRERPSAAYISHPGRKEQRTASYSYGRRRSEPWPSLWGQSTS